MTFFRLLSTSKTNRPDSCRAHILTDDPALVQSAKQRLGNTSVGIFNPDIPLINRWQPELCSIEIDFQIRVIAIERIPTFLDLGGRRRRRIYHQQAFQAGVLLSTRIHPWERNAYLQRLHPDHILSCSRHLRRNSHPPHPPEFYGPYGPTGGYILALVLGMDRNILPRMILGSGKEIRPV